MSPTFEKILKYVLVPLVMAVAADYAKAAADGNLSNPEIVHLSSVAVAFLLGLFTKKPWNGEDRREGSSENGQG